MGFLLFFVSVFLITILKPMQVIANGYLTDGIVVSSEFVERDVIPRDYITELGVHKQMYSETEGYVVYTYPLIYSGDWVFEYASEVMFFELVMQSKTLGEIVVPIGQNAGNVFVVITGKSTYIACLKENVMATSNITSSTFISIYGDFSEAIWKTENLTNRLYMNDFQFDITLFNINALNTGDVGYDITQDKGSFITILYQDVKGDNIPILNENDNIDLLVSAVKKYMPVPISALITAYDTIFTVADYILEYIAEEEPYVPYETLESRIVELPQNKTDYTDGQVVFDFYRYVLTSQTSDSENTVSGVAEYNIDGTINETSFDSTYAKMSYTANSEGGIYGDSNLMGVIIGFNFNVGRKVGLENIQLTSFSEKVSIDNNKYVGLLDRGYYSSDELKEELDVHVYKAIPNFSGIIAFDSLEENVSIHLFDKNGDEINLYYNTAGYYYSSANVVYGETYFVSIQNSVGAVHEALTLRYYRVLPFTGYADFPSVISGYDEKTTIYEYNVTSSGSRTFQTGTRINAGVIIKIYDSNWNLLTTRTATSFTYYLVSGRKYYIVYKALNLDSEEEMFTYNISIFQPSSC